MRYYDCCSGHTCHCRRYAVRSYGDDAGGLTVDTSGDLSVGIGGGLGVDLEDGDLTVEVAPGISIDTGIELF